MTPLTNNVRVFRQAHGEGLRELARAIGMDPSQLSRLEKGRGGCSDEMKLAIAQHFGVSVLRVFFQPNVDILDTAGVVK